MTSPEVLSPTLYPTLPSGACPLSQLPHELMAEIFLHLDPFNLYCTVRSLNKAWKRTVEEFIIPMLFKTGKWRIALRIHRRIRQPQQQQGLPAPAQIEGESEADRRRRVEETFGSWEDELEGDPAARQDVSTANGKMVITQYLPLQLKRVNPTDHCFEFTTGDDWYALYELEVRQQQQAPRPATNGQPTAVDAGLLDLDFGIAWRFDGDGKEGEEQRPGGWTKLDQENGWLSKFYCSGFDLKKISTKEAQNIKASSNGDVSSSAVKLNSTRLARRRRLPPRERPADQRRRLHWSDEHLEYIHLDLALGTEFFVRRSAGANLLMRALEAEAARRDEEELRDEQLAATSALSVPPSPNLAPVSPPAAVKPMPYLHRPIAERKAAAASSRGGTKSGTSTPPPSRASETSHSQLRPDLSPAEQLQWMAKSKAAAKASWQFGPNASPQGKPGKNASYRMTRGGSGGSGSNSGYIYNHTSSASSRGGSRVPSRASSAVPSRAPSAAPSRAVSRAPTRPTSPTPGQAPTPQQPISPPSFSLNSGDTSIENGTLSPSGSISLVPTPSATTPYLPGTPLASPRDLPFFRATALAQSTASPYTRGALSGYTTPRGRDSLGRRGGGAARQRLRRALTSQMQSSSSSSEESEDEDDEKVGGAPSALFVARLRRAEGFEPLKTSKQSTNDGEMEEGMNGLHLGGPNGKANGHRYDPTDDQDEKENRRKEEERRSKPLGWTPQEVRKDGTKIGEAVRVAQIKTISSSSEPADAANGEEVEENEDWEWKWEWCR